MLFFSDKLLSMVWLPLVLLILISISLGFYNLYLLISKRPKYETDGILLGKDKILWNEIISISTVFGGIGVFFQIKTNQAVYTTSPTWNRNKFVEEINKLGLFEVVNKDWQGYPLRWTKKGYDYERTGLFDLFMEPSLMFLNPNTAENKILFYILAAVFIGFIIFVLIKESGLF